MPYTAEKAKLIVKEMTDLLVLDLVDKKLLTDQMVLHIGYDIESLTDPEVRRKYQGELMGVSGYNLAVSLVWFLALMLGTGVLPHVMDITINYGSDTYWCRGGIFVNLCIVFLIILTITGSDGDKARIRKGAVWLGKGHQGRYCVRHRKSQGNRYKGLRSP